MFFKKKKKEETEVEFKCEYNQNDECNLLQQLKEKQKELTKISLKVNRLIGYEFEFTALHSLLRAMEKYNVKIGKRYPPYQWVAVPESSFEKHIECCKNRCIQDAVASLPSLEIIDEIKCELERCYETNAEIERLQRSSSILKKEITELKEKLGIR